MMTININQPLKDLSGVEIPDANAGKVLADWIAKQQSGNALKNFLWASSLWQTGIVQMDAVDFNELYAQVERSDNGLTHLAKGQILTLLKEQKDAHIKE